MKPMPKPWVQMPTDWIRFDHKLLSFTWASSEGQRSVALAALELYVTICFFCTRQTLGEGDEGHYELVADISYTALREYTGMSKALVSKGLQKLVLEGLIEIRQQGKRNLYALCGFTPDRGWCKLPARALIHENRSEIVPFKNFTRRNKLELYALKMFLLLAANRDKSTPFAMSSYNTIEKDAGIPRNMVKKAQGFLISYGFLDKVDFDREEHSLQMAANKYYLAGHRVLAHNPAQVSSPPPTK